MKKAIKAHEEKDAKVSTPKQTEEGAIPAYLLDRRFYRSNKQVMRLFDNYTRRMIEMPSLIVN